MKYLLSFILNVAVGQNVQSVKNAVGQNGRRSKIPSVKMAIGQNSVGQNGRRSKLRRSKDLEPKNIFFFFQTGFIAHLYEIFFIYHHKSISSIFQSSKMDVHHPRWMINNDQER
jgi:hypothetical protein